MAKVKEKHKEKERRSWFKTEGRHDYDIVDRFEAGIVLQGTEVKSLRAGKVNLKDSYALVEAGEVFYIESY